MWWEALPQVERLASSSIDRLVGSVEGQISSERDGWKASSEDMQAKMEQALEGIAAAAEGEDNTRNAAATGASPLVVD